MRNCVVTRERRSCAGSYGASRTDKNTLERSDASPLAPRAGNEIEALSRMIQECNKQLNVLQQAHVEDISRMDDLNRGLDSVTQKVQNIHELSDTLELISQKTQNHETEIKDIFNEIGDSKYSSQMQEFDVKIDFLSQTIQDHEAKLREADGRLMAIEERQSHIKTDFSTPRAIGRQFGGANGRESDLDVEKRLIDLEILFQEKIRQVGDANGREPNPDVEKRLIDLEILLQEKIKQAEFETERISSDPSSEPPVCDAADHPVEAGQVQSVRITQSTTTPIFNTEDSLKKRSCLGHVLHDLAVDADWSCQIEESIWDSWFLLGARGHTRLDMCGHLSITVLYMLLMFSMAYVIASGSFEQDPFTPEFLDRLTFWRATQGHSIVHVNDYDDSSLASRVCSGDPALSVAGSQQLLYENIVTYHKEAYLPSMEIGPLVCLCCVGIFMILIINDVEMAFHKLLAIWNLRSSEGTRILWEGRKFGHASTCALTSVATSRCCLALSTFLLRCFLNLIMLYVGCEWLVFTINIPDLLLNATALSFLLNVHLDIFRFGAPHVVRVTIGSMEPIQMPQFAGRQFMPLFFGLVFLGLEVRFFSGALNSVREGMGQAFEILCGNNLDFAAAFAPDIGVFWTETKTFVLDLPMSRRPDGKYQALENIIRDYDSSKRYSFHKQTASEVFANKASSFIEYVYDLENCSDRADIHVGGHLYVLTNDAKWNDYPSCADFKDHCPQVTGTPRFLRTLCPETCGCLQPDSGLVFLSSASEGCPQRNWCYDEATLNSWGERHKMACRSCKDMPMQLLQPLASWNKTLEVVYRSGKFFRNDSSGVLAYSHMSTFGCAGLLNLSHGIRHTLCNSYSVPFFCPQACECDTWDESAKSVDCPWDCTYPGAGYGGGCHVYHPPYI